MLKTIAATLLVALVLALGLGWWILHTSHRAMGGILDVEWEPAAELAPGTSLRVGRVERPRAWRVFDVAVDLARVKLRVASIPGGGRLQDMIPPEAVVAINGGYFDPAFHPTGWVVDQEREIAPRQNRATGGVLALRGEQLFIGPASALAFPPEFAVQNTPRLVEAGQIGIHAEDNKRASRTVACDQQGHLHLVVIHAPAGDGPTLSETARFLLEDPETGGLGCQEALNLDGGPSTGIWLSPAAGITSALPTAAIAYGIAAVPR